MSGVGFIKEACGGLRSSSSSRGLIAGVVQEGEKVSPTQDLLVL